MAPFRLGLAPLRRGVGAVLIVFLLVGTVLYLRAQPSAPTAAPSSSADPSSAPDAEPLPSTATPEATGRSDSPSAEVTAIEVYADHATRAQPFETVRIQGTYHGGADTSVVVEVRERAKWRAYPVSPRTDQLGRFITYVELGQPGPHWIRVLDPEAKVTSEPFVLVIEG